MLPRSKTLFSITALVLLAPLAGTGNAQLRTDPSTWGSGHDGVRLHAEEPIDLRTTDAKPIDPYAFRRGLFSAMGLYEYKPMGAVPGQYARPHYAFGLHSDTMRDALALTGLDAESCVAPMLRLRARQTSVTGANSIAMTVFARCTFR
jgi:hypothetical protein